MFSLFKSAPAQPAPATPVADLPVVVPAVDIRDNGREVVLTADLPGVPATGLEVTVDGDHLTVRGVPNQGMPTELQIVHQESVLRIFERSFALSETIDRAAISARIQNGVATITLPRRGAVAPRKVQIAVS